jgi:signal transduction histidine kinase
MKAVPRWSSVVASNRRVQFDFRDSFAFGGGETLRAFSLFGLLLCLLLAIGAQVAFQELSIKVLKDRLDLGRAEAERIAREIEVIGDTGAGIDFAWVRENERALNEFIRQRISGQAFITYVDIRDRFGVQRLLVLRQAGPPTPPGLRTGEELPPAWPAGLREVAVPLRQRASRVVEGEVRVAVDQRPMMEELTRLRNSLRVKLSIATGLAVGVLVAGFFYVLHLLRKNRRLEQARQSADRASYVGLLASGLAHEIRNPLNAMSMNLQMLDEELQGAPSGEDGDLKELLESNKSEIKRLERLVNNFLAYARPARPRFERADLNRVVTDVLRFLEADFRLSGVEVRTDLAQLLPTIELDETLFKQALMNLLVNARQVMKNGGRVRVTTRAGASGDAVLEIADNGPGIPPDVKDRIFEVFFSSRGGGTGLGLPIARQIVERHGGTIEVETAEGVGTTFRIQLPRRHKAARRDSGAEATA